MSDVEKGHLAADLSCGDKFNGGYKKEPIFIFLFIFCFGLVWIKVGYSELKICPKFGKVF